MKKYIAPEINKMNFDPNDIIATTGSGNYMDFANDGTTVDPQDYFI